MARRPSTPPAQPSPPLALTEPRPTVQRKLEERIKIGAEIKDSLAYAPASHVNPLFETRDGEAFQRDIVAWSDYNEELLKRLFTDESVYKEYKYSSGPVSMVMDQSQTWRMYKKTADNQIAKLRSIVQRLDLYEFAGRITSAQEPPLRQLPQKILLVHGHDTAALHEVDRFLIKLGLETIVLSEQPNQGRAIIEKFEHYAAQVGFAVVLLTPDDIAASKSNPKEALRARQNVIFELGYFAGKLGRGRACLIRKGEVEIPSDLYGVIYTEFDAAGGWKLSLSRELQAAELKFDPTKLWA